jgi:hypothetical protein
MADTVFNERAERGSVSATQEDATECNIDFYTGRTPIYEPWAGLYFDSPSILSPE